MPISRELEAEGESATTTVLFMIVVTVMLVGRGVTFDDFMLDTV